MAYPTKPYTAPDNRASILDYVDALQQGGVGVVNVSAPPYSGDFAMAAAAASAGGYALVVSSAITVSTAIGTVTSPLMFVGGGKLVMAAGGSITIAGPVQAPLSRIFDTSGGGTVTFSGLVQWAFPEWWGAVDADATTTTTLAFQASLTASKHVYVNKGQWWIFSPLTAQASAVICGAGRNNAVISAWFTGANQALPAIDIPTGDGAQVRDLQIYGHQLDDTSYRASGIKMTGVNDGLVENVTLAGMSGIDASTVGYGLKLVSSGVTVRGCSFDTYRLATDIGLLLDGGSGYVLEGANVFRTRGIGITTLGNATGAIIRDSFFDSSSDTPAGPLVRTWDGIVWPKGNAALVVDGCYFEGSTGFPLFPWKIGQTGAGDIPVVTMTGNRIATGGTNQAIADGITSFVFVGNNVGDAGSNVQSGVAAYTDIENTFTVDANHVNAATRRVQLKRGSFRISGGGATLQCTFDGAGGIAMNVLNTAESNYTPLTAFGASFTVRPFGETTRDFTVDGNGRIIAKALRSSDPGAGSKEMWYDPADGNRMKYTP